MSLRKAIRNARKASNYGIGQAPRTIVGHNLRIDNFDTPEQTITELPDTIHIVDDDGTIHENVMEE